MEWFPLSSKKKKIVAVLTITSLIYSSSVRRCYQAESSWVLLNSWILKRLLNDLEMFRYLKMIMKIEIPFTKWDGWCLGNDVELSFHRNCLTWTWQWQNRRRNLPPKKHGLLSKSTVYQQFWVCQEFLTYWFWSMALRTRRILGAFLV